MRPILGTTTFGVAALVAGLCAAPSQAATVELARDISVDYGGGWAAIDYRGARGEANHVVLVQVDQMTIRVTDTGAPITPGRGCRALDAHSADCSVAGLRGYNGLIGAEVRAGDEDDTVDSRGPGLSGSGGPGDDTLQSSSLATGTLDGGDGHDTLLGGTNEDTFVDADADADLLDGREGGATVSYASHTAPVHVDLADPRPDGEDDTLRSITGVIGGRGADVLRGDDEFSRLAGGPGDDRLLGRGGDDFLEGGSGNDRIAAQAGGDYVSGGPGDDLLTGGDGDDSLDGGRGRDRLRGGEGQDGLLAGSAWCGAGEFDYVRPSRNDYVDRDCEQMDFFLPIRKGEFADIKAVMAEPYPSVRGGSATFRVQCPALDTDGYPDPVALRGALRLRGADGQLIGAGRIPAAGRRCADRGGADARSELPWVRVTARLNPAGRALLRRPGQAQVTVAFSGRNVPPIPWRIRLG